MLKFLVKTRTQENENPEVHPLYEAMILLK